MSTNSPPSRQKWAICSMCLRRLTRGSDSVSEFGARTSSRGHSSGAVDGEMTGLSLLRSVISGISSWGGGCGEGGRKIGVTRFNGWMSGRSVCDGRMKMIGGEVKFTYHVSRACLTVTQRNRSRSSRHHLHWTSSERIAVSIYCSYSGNHVTIALDIDKRKS